MLFQALNAVIWTALLQENKAFQHVSLTDNSYPNSRAKVMLHYLSGYMIYKLQ